MTKDGFCATKKDAGFDESPAPPPPNDAHCAARDAYWRCVPPGCAMYYDGCNRCAVHGNTLARAGRAVSAFKTTHADAANTIERESRRRRGREAIPWRRVAATPRL